MRRVVVVDDDERVCLTMRQWLVHEGRYEVFIATGARQGLKLARAKTPDVILLDIDMPKMNGIEVLRKLGEDKRTRFIPVIMVTGRDETEMKELAMYEYAERYLTKPIERHQLMETIEKVLSLRGDTGNSGCCQRETTCR